MPRSPTADRARSGRARSGAVLAALLGLGCASLAPASGPSGAGAAPPATDTTRAGGTVGGAAPGARAGAATGETEPRLPRRQPYLRVGLAVGLDSIEVSAEAGLRARDLATGRRLAAESGRWTIRMVPGGLEALPVAAAGAGPGGGDGGPGQADAAAGPRQDLLFESRRDSGAVRVDGRTYRGGVEVLALPDRGLVLINRVRLEHYLLGVVPLEIGPRGPAEEAAVRAQAVAARTYALANLGRRDSLGFDLFSSVEDQVYGGVEAERPEATRAVRATRGQVLTWRDRPIRAYYHADGGGRTARVDEVWNLPDAPYLQSVADTASNGEDWGASDPRHVWEVRWTAAELAHALDSGLSSYYGSPVSRTDRVTALRVLGRTPSGRVAALEIRTEGGRYVVERNDVRFVLLRPDGKVLPSTLFQIETAPDTGSGGLTVRGRGNGHGVGMCQWGAIGRARAGQTYGHILAAYYPGAELRTAY